MDATNSTPLDNSQVAEVPQENASHIEIISQVIIPSETTDSSHNVEVPETGEGSTNAMDIINNSTEIAEPVKETESSVEVMEIQTVDSEPINQEQQPAEEISQVISSEQAVEIVSEVTEAPQTISEAFVSEAAADIMSEVTEMLTEQPVEEVPQIPQITDQSSADQADSSYTSHILKSLNTGGLGMLSAYDSGDDSGASDTESVIEVPTTSLYRNQVIEINSDDSSSSSSDEECDLQKKRNELEKLIQVDDDSEDEEGFKKQPPKVQGELLLDDLPPIEDLHITVPEQECVELGTVSSVIEQLLLVKTIYGAPLLDIGTVLFLEKGQKVLGAVFDVLGQVSDPLYCVRFNSNQQIKEKEIKVGDKVYCAPRTEHTQLIILSNLTKLKGSDASWENDIEPPSKYVEYSDDEEEQAARRSRRVKNRNEYRPSDEGEVVDLTKKPRQQTSNRGRQPRQQGSQQYYQQMHQQQPFNYDGNTWHSNFQSPQFVANPYALQQGNYPQNPGFPQGNFQQNQGNQRNFQRNNRNQRVNYSQNQGFSGGFPQNQPQGSFPQNNQPQGSFPQNNQAQGIFPQSNQQQQGFPQNNPQYYQGQAAFYQQGGGGYQ